MANTISTTIAINDNISKAFQNINKSISSVISGFERMETASGNAIDTAALASARKYINDAEKAFRNVDETIDQVRESINRSEKSQNSFKNSVRTTDSVAQGLKSTFLKIGAAVTAALSGKQVIELSDTVAQTRSRLDLMNDGLQSTEELQQKIFDSATRARGAYQSTADAVSKMGILAGDAFSSNDEIIAFLEQVNKQFTISGTSADGVQAAMLQLTQAMGAGALRGEELNSVLEQAPTIVQTIAKYLGVNVGTLRDMASEGQITSEVVKTALLAAADETNAKFEAMPKTFSQIWTDFKNQALFAFQPVLEGLNEIANSSEFNNFVQGAMSALTAFAPVAISALDSLFSFATSDSVVSFFTTVRDTVIQLADAFASLVGAENPAGIFEAIAGAAQGLLAIATPLVSVVGDIVSALIGFAGTDGGQAVILGLAAAFTTLGIGMAGVKISAFITSIKALSSVGTFTAGLKALAASSKIATAAQWLFNTSLYGCPIVWIIAAIMALIVVIILCVKYWDQIKAAALVCWDAIKNAWGAVSSWFKGIWDSIVSIAQSAWNGIKSVFSAVGSWFAGLWNGIVSIAQSVWNRVVSVISSVWNTIWGVISPIVTAIWNLISSVFGAIASIISAIMQGIWATIQRVWNSIVSFITPILQAIWTTVTNIWNNIWTTITTVCTSIWNTIVSIWNTITSAVSTAVNAVLSVVSSIWNSISSVTSSIWNSIKSKISEIWNGIVSAVANKVKEVYDKVKGKFDEVLDFLGDLKDKMLTKGKEIIQGLIDGIASKINAVADKIREVGSTVTNGIKDFFNINSPSKVMRELGQWTFEGFNVGLQNMIDKIRRTTVNMGEVVTKVMPTQEKTKEPQRRPSDFAAMRQTVSNVSSSRKTINAPVTVKVDNNNSFTSEADISSFTRRLANSIAERIGMQLEGAMI